ncbi:hypothetical protein [Scandinavium goeteborgense]|uniref:Uncharacterized protein n=1 Tax=Scandinavium goeteborgense TaxID=1851514 RepID=A0A4R6EQI8_SCAGO|nr:hypothetical protein EC847_102369 [Scandinavium goeteborgense]
MTDKQALRGQILPPRYYLAECQGCGVIMPSNKLVEAVNFPDGDADIHCPHCNADDCDIMDLGAGEEPGAIAWNYQQKRIESLLDALEASQTEREEFRSRLKLVRAILSDADKRIAEQADIIAKQEKWIKDVEATMIASTDRAEAAEKRIAELEANEIREEDNQFLIVRYPGKAPTIKHATGDLNTFLKQLMAHDPLITIDIVTYRYYGVGGQWVQDADEYLAAAGIALDTGE